LQCSEEATTQLAARGLGAGEGASANGNWFSIWRLEAVWPDDEMRRVGYPMISIKRTTYPIDRRVLLDSSDAALIPRHTWLQFSFLLASLSKFKQWQRSLPEMISIFLCAFSGAKHLNFPFRQGI